MRQKSGAGVMLRQKTRTVAEGIRAPTEADAFREGLWIRGVAWC